MQPYLFPYLGYFQLVNKVDRFIFLDDVNYIKRGWVNRNRLILSGRIGYFTVPLRGASQNSKICDVLIDSESTWSTKLKKSIEQSYSNSPHFKETKDLIWPILFGREASISDLAKQSVVETSKHLRLNVDIIYSSKIYANNFLSGQDRIIDICKKECCTEYWNLPNGRRIYDQESFKKNGINLHFIEPAMQKSVPLPLNLDPELSIIHLLMNIPLSSVKNLLK